MHKTLRPVETGFSARDGRSIERRHRVVFRFVGIKQLVQMG